jgi:predicted secreted protein
MAWPLATAIFFTTWWIALFAVLPLTGHSREEQRPEDWPEGADPGAPSRPRILLAVLWTTLIAILVLAAIEAYVIWAP